MPNVYAGKYQRCVFFGWVCVCVCVFSDQLDIRSWTLFFFSLSKYYWTWNRLQDNWNILIISNLFSNKLLVNYGTSWRLCNINICLCFFRLDCSIRNTFMMILLDLLINPLKSFLTDHKQLLFCISLAAVSQQYSINSCWSVVIVYLWWIYWTCRCTSGS